MTLWLTPTPAEAIDRPAPISVAGVIVGETTFSQMKSLFGSIRPVKTGDAHDSAFAVCLLLRGQDATIRVEFLSHLEGADWSIPTLDRTIDLVRVQTISKASGEIQCDTRVIDGLDLVFSNGVKLGLNRADVERLLGTDFSYGRYWGEIDALTYGKCWEEPLEPGSSDYQDLNSRRNECFGGKAPYIDWCQYVEIRLQGDRVMLIEAGIHSGIC